MKTLLVGLVVVFMVVGCLVVVGCGTSETPAEVLQKYAYAVQYKDAEGVYKYLTDYEKTKDYPTVDSVQKSLNSTEGFDFAVEDGIQVKDYYIEEKEGGKFSKVNYINHLGWDCTAHMVKDSSGWKVGNTSWKMDHDTRY